MTSLEELAPGVYLYIWEGRVTREDIRHSMMSVFYRAERVVFDISEVEVHPFSLVGDGSYRHRKITGLEHIYVVPRPGSQIQAEMLVKVTLPGEYSFHTSRESAVELALKDAGVTA